MHMLSKKYGLLSIITAMIIAITYWQFTKVDWTVLNENIKYVDLRKVHAKHSIIIAAPVNKWLWSNVFALAQISQQLKQIDGRIGLILPLDIGMVLETAEKVKRQNNLDIDIYVAPDGLWKKLFNIKGNDIEKQANLEPKFIFIKNEKIIKITQEKTNWFSDEGMKFVNNIFRTKINLIGYL